MSPSCVHLIRTSWSPTSTLQCVTVILPPRTYAPSSGDGTRATSLPLHLCASGGVKPGRGSQRWIHGSRLLQGVTFPWPLCLVPGWAGGHVRANETNRLSWGVPERRPFVLFLQAAFNRKQSGGLKPSRYHMDWRQWSLGTERN